MASWEAQADSVTSSQQSEGTMTLTVCPSPSDSVNDVCDQHDPQDFYTLLWDWFIYTANVNWHSNSFANEAVPLTPWKGQHGI